MLIVLKEKIPAVEEVEVDVVCDEVVAVLVELVAVARRVCSPPCPT
jgi:hypothetical protein